MSNRASTARLTAMASQLDRTINSYEGAAIRAELEDAAMRLPKADAFRLTQIWLDMIRQGRDKNEGETVAHEEGEASR